jgi:hypothetical protein
VISGVPSTSRSPNLRAPGICNTSLAVVRRRRSKATCKQPLQSVLAHAHQRTLFRRSRFSFQGTLIDTDLLLCLLEDNMTQSIHEKESKMKSGD